jgi:hypothetical protein
MRRTNLLTASLATALIGCGLLGSSVFAQATVPHGQVVGSSLAAPPQSRMQARQAIDDATAAALIGAISSQFDEPNVVVKLDHVEASPAGIIQRELHGAGRLQIGTDETWIPFGFQALYDSQQSSVGNPRVTLGDESGQGSVADATMTKKLTAVLAQRLHQEFAQQPVRIALGSVRTVAAGKNYLQVQARGTANFGKEGATDADVHGLYDVRKDQWVQLDYELGAALDSSTPAEAVASL